MEWHKKIITEDNKARRLKKEEMRKKIETLNCPKCKNNDNIILLMSCPVWHIFCCRSCGSRIKIGNAENLFSSPEKEGSGLPVLPSFPKTTKQGRLK